VGKTKVAKQGGVLNLYETRQFIFLPNANESIGLLKDIQCNLILL
jgi:hypothetical protein